MSRYHTLSVFLPPRPGGGSGGGEYAVWGFETPRKRGRSALREDRDRSGAIRGRAAKGERRPRPLRARSPSAAGKRPGRATRGDSPAAALTSRKVHSSEGTRRGRRGDEVIPGSAEKESREKERRKVNTGGETRPGGQSSLSSDFSGPYYNAA
ncbi:unnamed protein product [Rangifer tarandus platyrhynchus]|uniref:Uncharacterized protein n=3 Tax=Rangifer tarandus platyrhynchus TaxID=3082113 RepID=A0ABN8XKU9_RANTA|nr:unnamed protein product [Rangifer tarandus platyrhynchus]CAI9150977.1 unnamed protein product [Rangifer tarandus platyrhynchus]